MSMRVANNATLSKSIIHAFVTVLLDNSGRATAPNQETKDQMPAYQE